jgi:IMP dehydrogenase
MRKYNSEEMLSFDDILLVPQYADIASRKDVSLKSTIGIGTKRSIGLSLPLIAAPMDTVCEWEMAAAMRKSGGLGIIHRYMPIEKQVEQVKLAVAAGQTVGGSVGARGDFLSEASLLYDAGASMVLIDVANGHSQYAIDAVKRLRQMVGNQHHIMAGNVSTWEGYARLADAGVDSVRVGIGGGSACTTRVVSGHGMPTLASIMDIRKNYKYGDGPDIIADGGIRNSGDAAKALAAGANAVMVGRILAGTDESPGEVVDGRKIFRGMASREAQEDGRGSVSGVEGISTTIPYVGKVENVLQDFEAGLRSALSYTGVENLIDFHTESVYNRVSSNSLNETKPHAKE